jgi:hypothetical protein
MNAKVRKEWEQLTPASQKRVEQYWIKKYSELLERNMRIMLDLYMKMVCVTLHDKCDMTEEELYLFLGHHKELFREQVMMVRSDEQIDYLDRRMAEIFKGNGFPQGFFDKMLGEAVKPQENG